MTEYHNSVMSNEILSSLNLKDGGIYVDATLGGGGHTRMLLEANDTITVYAFDKDKEAIEYNKQLTEQYPQRVHLFNDNFVYMRSRLALQKIAKVDGIVFDLGISNHQISTASRGISFDLEGNLDMRMNQDDELTAADIVNKYPAAELAAIIKTYGEEKESYRIAKGIELQRRNSPIKTTFQLAEIVEKNTLSPHKIKAKARVFQALRVYLNGELEVLKNALYDAVEMMNISGRIVVLSYHSLEDRIVKQLFVEETKECVCPKNFPKCVCDKRARLKIITKKPQTPSQEEISINRSARSAKMRVAERI